MRIRPEDAGEHEHPADNVEVEQAEVDVERESRRSRRRRSGRCFHRCPFVASLVLSYDGRRTVRYPRDLGRQSGKLSAMSRSERSCSCGTRRPTGPTGVADIDRPLTHAGPRRRGGGRCLARPPRRAARPGDLLAGQADPADLARRRASRCAGRAGGPLRAGGLRRRRARPARPDPGRRRRHATVAGHRPQPVHVDALRAARPGRGGDPTGCAPAASPCTGTPARGRRVRGAVDAASRPHTARG